MTCPMNVQIGSCRQRRLRRHWARRAGAAFMMALFVMTVCSVLVVSIVDTQVLQFTSLRNTMNYDRARYLAEAGVAHALGVLEQDWDSTSLRATGIASTEFPAGSGNFYSAAVSDGANGTVVVNATGTAGAFSRNLQITVKMGG